MTIPLHKAVVNLHAGLSQDGINRATNENEYNDITPIWFDLTRSGRYGQLKGYEKYLDGGWLGDNSPNNPFALNINRPENSVEIVGTANFPNADTNHMAMDMWVKFRESGKVVTKGELGTAGFDVLYDRDNFSLEVNATTRFNKSQVVAKGIYPEQWYHFTVNLDSNYLWVIINGETIITSKLVPGSYTINDANYTIGGGFTGELNSIRLYNDSLDWLDIENIYHAGLYIKYAHSDLKIRGFGLARSEMQGLIKVEPVNVVRAVYSVMGHYEHDMESFISVTEFVDLKGTINVPNIVFARANYIIDPHDELDIPSTITVNQHRSLPGTIQVNHTIRAVAKYDIVTQRDVNQSYLHSQIRVIKEVTDNFTDVFARARYEISLVKDLPGTITVNHLRDLPGKVLVNPTGRLVARYGIQGTHISELPITGIVPFRSDLGGRIQVLMNARMSARYRIQTIEIEDLPSSINVNATSQLKSQIIVPHQGHARALYNVSPIVYEWLPSELNVAEFSELFGTILVSYRTMARAKYEVTPIYFSWLESNLTVREISDLKGVIFISKEFHAVARYGISERPNYDIIAYPNKDAYVREFFPRINYGSVNQLYVGNIGSPFPEKYKTYIAFDLSRLPQDNVEIGSAKLKLYYDGRNGSQRIKITAVTEQWQEHSITWANRPGSVEDDESLVYYYDVPEKSDYLEIDVRNIVDKWAKQELYNCGFLIELENDATRKLTGFYSKESQELRPELHINYYDMKVYSDDKVWLDGTITVRNFVNSDLKGRINVHHRWLVSDLPSDIRVKYPYDLDGEIRVGNPNFPCYINVRNDGEDDLESTIAVRVSDVSDLDGYMFANEKEKPSYIYVLYRSDLESDVVVRRSEYSDLDSLIGISEGSKESSIIVPFYEGLDSDITVSQFGYSDLEGTIELSGNRLLIGTIDVRREGSSELDGGLFVRSYEDLPSDMYVNQPHLWSEIGVQRYEEEDLISSVEVRFYDSLPSTLNVFNPSLNSYIDVFNVSDLESSLTIRFDGHSDLEMEVGVKPTSDLEGNIFANNGDYLVGNISVRRSRYDLLRGSIDIKPYDSLEGEMLVSNPNLKGYISTIQFHLMPGTIDVRRDDKHEMESEIWVPYRYDLEGNMLIRVSSQITGRIIVISGNLFSNIQVPAYDKKDLRGNISARVRMVSDLPTSIVIASGLLSSYISVRHSDYRDLPSTVIIRGAEHDNLESNIYVRFTEDLESSISVSKPRWINLPSYIAVRRSDLSDLECTIAVRVWNDPWTDGGQLEGTISVRRDATNDLESHIAVRRDGLSDLLGTISAKQISELEGTIAVRRDDYSDLESTISARQTDKSDLPGLISAKQISELESTISARQFAWSDLDSTIRVFQIHEMESDITVRQYGESDLPVTVAIRNDSQHDLGGTIDVFQISSMDSDITVRQADNSDLDGIVAVQRTEYNDLEGTITARQFGHKDLRCTIVVRRTDDSDLPSTIITKKKVDLECSIEVMTAYPYAFIM